MIDLEELLDTLHLEDLQNSTHPSIFDENDGYDVLIVKLPIISKDLSSKSIGFVITPTSSYQYSSEESIFSEFDNRFTSVHKILDRHIDKLLKSFNRYQDLIEQMEENLYANKIDKDFMKQWLDLKKDISMVERITFRTSSKIQDMIESYENEEEFPINSYIDLHEHMERISRSSTFFLSKLDYFYSFYKSRTDEKMNSLIYTLTIISAIFLPLNLLVGYFGMNTSGLPFSAGDFGTLNVTLVMTLLVLITVSIIYFVQKKNRS